MTIFDVKHRNDKPPAYAEVVDESSAPHTNILPAPTVPQLHLYTKHADIKGTFYVDPSAPRLNQPSKAERKLLADSQASFRSRKGKITIDVGTTGRGAKASAVVWSRKGDININILPLSPNRPHISLDVSSRKGKVVLLMPDTYRGILHLNTKKGSLEFLPALAQVMQTFKMTSKEALVYVGGKNDEEHGDYCQIHRRIGAVEDPR
ncbi:hypothetical protein AX15_006553 [Amanita polypyramis BW_CC]|nr:hypothetical protein AX15_006553 [Amanita polypyramis BW_CC]